MKVIGYPQPGKEKSRRLVGALVQGAGGELADARGGLRGERHAAAFYGTQGIEELFREARALPGRGLGHWLYIDNSFFDVSREAFFRVGVDMLQGPLGAPDYARLDALGVAIQPWRKGGRHILLCPQSDYFMREVLGRSEPWAARVMRELAKYTDRTIVVRAWSQDKVALSRTLGEDLEDCWALVTDSSAAAIGALLAGVPVFITGESPALLMGLAQLSEIERPRRPDGRELWAARLAASQWTLEEMREGKTWRELVERLNLGGSA